MQEISVQRKHALRALPRTAAHPAVPACSHAHLNFINIVLIREVGNLHIAFVLHSRLRGACNNSDFAWTTVPYCGCAASNVTLHHSAALPVSAVPNALGPPNLPLSPGLEAGAAATHRSTPA